jgi:hypothetical protein
VRAPEIQPAGADPALPAGAERRRRDRLSFPPAGDIPAEGGDPPAELVTEDLAVRGLPLLQGVHVRPAQSARVDGDDHLIGRRNGIGDLGDLGFGPMALHSQH